MSVLQSDRGLSFHLVTPQYAADLELSTRQKPMAYKHNSMLSASSKPQIRRCSPLPTPPPSTRSSIDSGGASLTPPPTTNTSLDLPSTSGTRISVEDVVFEIMQFRDGATGLGDSTDRLVIPNVPNSIWDALEDYFPDVRLRLTHRVDTHSLTVKRCPTEVHECVGKFFSSQELMLQEWAQIHCPNATVDALGSSTQDLQQGGHKEPDESFYVSTSGDLPVAPAVVIETGYSEKYSELRKDVEDWLLRANPEIHCVIIVWFTPPRKMAQRWDTTRWIGELEIYERSKDPGEVSLYGKRIRFLPPITSEDIPSMSLHIRHFLPNDLVVPELKQELQLSLADLVDKVTRCLRLTLLKKRRRERGEEEEEDGEGSSKRSKTTKA